MFKKIHSLNHMQSSLNDLNTHSCLELNGIVVDQNNIHLWADALSLLPLNVTDIHLSSIQYEHLENINRLISYLPDHIQKLTLQDNSYGSDIKLIKPLMTSIPSSIKVLDWSLNDFDCEVFSYLEFLPQSVKSIDLSDNNLFSKGHDIGFKLLPKSCQEIKIGSMELHKCGISTLKNIFKSIPKTVKTLHLDDNCLSEFNIEQLTLLFRNLRHVNSLNLSNNGLGLQPCKTFSSMMKSLSMTINHLDLSFNQLDQSFNQVDSYFLECLPTSLRSLNLKGNYLGCLNGSRFIEFIKHFPKKIENINLSYNQLHHLNEDVWFTLQDSFLNRSISIDLSSNFLGKMPYDAFERFIQCLPKNLIHLDLSQNHMSSWKGADFNYALSYLPVSLESLNLSDNKLHHLTSSMIGELFLSLPKSLNHLDLSLNEFVNPHDFGWVSAFMHLPSELKSIMLKETIFKLIPECIVKLLMGELPKSLKTMDSSDNNIK